jgi:protein TonB
VFVLKASAQSDMLVPAKNDEGVFGYVNQFGKKIIDYDFDWAGAFHRGYAVIMQADSFYYINRDGVIVSDGYELAYPFLYSFTLVSKNGLFSYVDTTFKVLNNKWFQQALLFQRGYALCKDKKNQYMLSMEGRFMRVSNNYSIPVQGEIFEVVQKMPYFPGGNGSMNAYFKKQLPAELHSRLVYVSFVVEKDGSLSQVNLMGDSSQDAGKTIIRAFEQMPAWIPGREAGEIVRVRMSIPLIVTQDMDAQ